MSGGVGTEPPGSGLMRGSWEPRLQGKAGAGHGSPQAVGSELGLKSGSRGARRGVVEQRV